MEAQTRWVFKSRIRITCCFSRKAMTLIEDRRPMLRLNIVSRGDSTNYRLNNISDTKEWNVCLRDGTGWNGMGRNGMKWDVL